MVISFGNKLQVHHNKKSDKWIRWFIVGGSKPTIKTMEKDINKPVKQKPSPERIKQAMFNAGSNMGLMDDAEKWWYEQPYHWRKQKEEELRKRYQK